ncbi:hypothetical protein [Scopulibacillus cellulosilyticus]|uniref:Uncharacterized protein n=1 Tax=Scopulibacillus cellulosilyticus TaxID=2665665 RepID=A0ABW2Q4A4_9BACL
MEQMDLNSLTIGDSVLLEDGEYTFNQYIFIVKDSIIKHIYSSVIDSNQLSLEIEPAFI